MDSQQKDKVITRLKKAEEHLEIIVDDGEEITLFKKCTKCMLTTLIHDGEQIDDNCEQGDDLEEQSNGYEDEIREMEQFDEAVTKLKDKQKGLLLC